MLHSTSKKTVNIKLEVEFNCFCISNFQSARVGPCYVFIHGFQKSEKVNITRILTTAYTITVTIFDPHGDNGGDR